MRHRRAGGLAVLILFCACGASAVKPAPAASWAARALPLTIDGANIFSDRDEAPDALTRISSSARDSAHAFTYRIERNPSLGYEYAGVSVPVGRDISSFRTFSFEARGDSGGNIEMIQAVTASNKRDHVNVGTFGSVGPEWKRFDIPFAAFAAVEADEWATMKRFAFLFGKPGGTLHIRNVTVNDLQLEPPSPFPAKYSAILKPARRPVDAAWLAWIYELDATKPETLRSARPAGSMILLSYVGSVDMDGVGFRNPGPRKSAMQSWLDAGYSFHAMVDGGGGNEWGTLSDEKYQAMADSVAAYMRAHPEYTGVHFDIEPYATRHALFYAMVKHALPDRIVSTAVGRWDRYLLDVCDYVVLMGYDRGSTPEKARADYEKFYPSFARDCEKRGVPFFMGIPAIATGHEYEMKHAYRDGKDTQVMPHKMEDFLDAALNVVDQPGIRGLTQYRGIAIWGLLHEPVGKPWGFHTYPWQLKPEVINRLRVFERG